METRGSDEPVCSFCDSKRLGLVMDFGEVGLAGAFLKPEQFAAERTFPMRLHFCRDCYAVQVTDKVPPDVMFENYFYFSSSIGTLRDHFQRLCRRGDHAVSGSGQSRRCWSSAATTACCCVRWPTRAFAP